VPQSKAKANNTCIAAQPHSAAAAALLSQTEWAYAVQPIGRRLSLCPQTDV